MILKIIKIMETPDAIPENSTDEEFEEFIASADEGIFDYISALRKAEQIHQERLNSNPKLRIAFDFVLACNERDNGQRIPEPIKKLLGDDFVPQDFPWTIDQTLTKTYDQQLMILKDAGILRKEGEKIIEPGNA